MTLKEIEIIGEGAPISAYIESSYYFSEELAFQIFLEGMQGFSSPIYRTTSITVDYSWQKSSQSPIF
jgi:hypothetical protein